MPISFHRKLLRGDKLITPDSTREVVGFSMFLLEAMGSIIAAFLAIDLLKDLFIL